VPRLTAALIAVLCVVGCAGRGATAPGSEAHPNAAPSVYKSKVYATGAAEVSIVDGTRVVRTRDVEVDLRPARHVVALLFAFPRLPAPTSCVTSVFLDTALVATTSPVNLGAYRPLGSELLAFNGSVPDAPAPELPGAPESATRVSPTDSVVDWDVHDLYAQWSAHDPAPGTLFVVAVRTAAAPDLPGPAIETRFSGTSTAHPPNLVWTYQCPSRDWSAQAP
jgi:hypothetical protein